MEHLSCHSHRDNSKWNAPPVYFIPWRAYLPNARYLFCIRGDPRKANVRNASAFVYAIVESLEMQHFHVAE